MSFIQREIGRIDYALSKEHEESKTYKELYIVRQALRWALDPRKMKSAVESIMGLEIKPEDYDPDVTLPIRLS